MKVSPSTSQKSKICLVWLHSDLLLSSPKIDNIQFCYTLHFISMLSIVGHFCLCSVAFSKIKQEPGSVKDWFVWSGKIHQSEQFPNCQWPLGTSCYDRRTNTATTRRQIRRAQLPKHLVCPQHSSCVTSHTWEQDLEISVISVISRSSKRVHINRNIWPQL